VCRSRTPASNLYKRGRQLSEVLVTALTKERRGSEANDNAECDKRIVPFVHWRFLRTHEKVVHRFSMSMGLHCFHPMGIHFLASDGLVCAPALEAWAIDLSLHCVRNTFHRISGGTPELLTTCLGRI